MPGKSASLELCAHVRWHLAVCLVLLLFKEWLVRSELKSSLQCICSESVSSTVCWANKLLAFNMYGSLFFLLSYRVCDTESKLCDVWALLGLTLSYPLILINVTYLKMSGEVCGAYLWGNKEWKFAHIVSFDWPPMISHFNWSLVTLFVVIIGRSSEQP